MDPGFRSHIKLHKRSHTFHIFVSQCTFHIKSFKVGIHWKPRMFLEFVSSQFSCRFQSFLYNFILTENLQYVRMKVKSLQNQLKLILIHWHMLQTQHVLVPASFRIVRRPRSLLKICISMCKTLRRQRRRLLIIRVVTTHQENCP